MFLKDLNYDFDYSGLVVVNSQYDDNSKDIIIKCTYRNVDVEYILFCDAIKNELEVISFLKGNTIKALRKINNNTFAIVLDDSRWSEVAIHAQDVFLVSREYIENKLGIEVVI